MFKTFKNFHAKSGKLLQINPDEFYLDEFINDLVSLEQDERKEFLKLASQFPNIVRLIEVFYTGTEKHPVPEKDCYDYTNDVNYYPIESLSSLLRFDSLIPKSNEDACMKLGSLKKGEYEILLNYYMGKKLRINGVTVATLNSCLGTSLGKKATSESNGTE